MLTIRPSATAPIAYTGQSDRKHIADAAKDNSTAMTIGGGAGVAAFGTIRESSRIGNCAVRLINTSKKIKADKQQKILRILENCKPLAGFAKNPIVRKVAGGLAGLSAATTLVGSTAKIADTYGFLANQAQ